VLIGEGEAYKSVRNPKHTVDEFLVNLNHFIIIYRLLSAIAQSLYKNDVGTLINKNVDLFIGLPTVGFNYTIYIRFKCRN